MAVATPIFDLIEAPPEPSHWKWGSVLIGVLVGLFLGLTPVMKLRYLPNLNGFLLFPALYVAIAIHEAGHLLFGGIVGMPPGALVIGGIVIFRSGQRWLIRFDRRRIFGGGLARVLTPKDEFRPRAFAWMIAGGPIASITLTFACGLAGVRHGNGPWGWVGSLFWASLLTSIVSLIPASSGLNKSDGARLLILKRNPEQSRSWMALNALQTEETQGIVPREWDSELVNQTLAAEPSTCEYPYVQLLAYYRCIDEKDEQKALEHLENALARSARSGKVLRLCLFLEAASSSAHLRGNAAQARAWLDRALLIQKPKSTEGVEAVIAICEKRYDDALRHLAAARTRLDRLKIDSGLVRFAREQLAGYERICSGVTSHRSGND
jgi:hypothetical protein